ncbi:5-oxoprolinase subunit PxpB [Sneathiella sp. P13V-1]|uniref:5-oxoprolinase subunit PxpB n=1 Tax=Sneathiella sp. P13V-1 TaxID=2697366 RepID=UPI00187B9F80|nr:5-oxoprolinase subunit PxpB [Sneathiella sp. P13V-1]MBE7637200.1 5-oxoprolinase subunit PxpB [Sneathiella sp. P13V-1]
MNSRFLMLGDSAFTVEFPDLSGVVGARHIRALRVAIDQKIEDGAIGGVLDIISAVRSLTLVMDPDLADFRANLAVVKSLVGAESNTTESAGTLWTLPACYEGEYAPDLQEIAERSGLSTSEVVDIHTGQDYDVLLIGFLPGFPFLGEIDERIRFPRRQSPRVKVPPGSVAIANAQTAIYPWESPGGWHLIGRCPVPLFDQNRSRPALMAPGDLIRFKPVSEEVFKELDAAYKSGELSLEDLASTTEVQK